MAGKDKELGGRFYGDNKERTCKDCGFTANWREFTPYDGNPSETVCDSCTIKRKVRNQQRLKKEDIRDFDNLDRYLRGMRGNGPFGSFFNAMFAGIFRGWVKRMHSYGPFNEIVAAGMLSDHYSNGKPRRRNHWLVMCADIELESVYLPLRRFKHPWVKRIGKVGRDCKFIKAGDTVFLWSDSSLEKTVGLRSTELLPLLGVELPLQIPSDMPREYRIDVFSQTEVIPVPKQIIVDVLATESCKLPTEHECTLLTAHCSEQLETIFRNKQSKGT